MHRADFFDLEPLQIMDFLKEQFPPEAKVRGSNPLEHVIFYLTLTRPGKKSDLTLKFFSKKT